MRLFWERLHGGHFGVVTIQGISFRWSLLGCNVFGAHFGNVTFRGVHFGDVTFLDVNFERSFLGGHCRDVTSGGIILETSCFPKFSWGGHFWWENFGDVTYFGGSLRG
jgi:uncharacterized protein YjbI with pentapeptide repeats